MSVAVHGGNIKTAHLNDSFFQVVESQGVIFDNRSFERFSVSATGG
jgi:hypothetical protein